MRYLNILAFAFAILVPLAGTAASPTPPACGSKGAPPCAATSAAPAVLTVSIQADAARVAEKAAPPADDKPYVGWWKRSPFMRWMVWYCAIMFPVAIVALTVWSVAETKKRRLVAGR